MFTMFLDKTNKRKIAFFQYLENKTLLTETREILMEQLGMSEFLVNKTIDELNEDFEIYNLAHEFTIISDGNTVVLKQQGRGTSEILVYCYVKDSLSFSMLRQFFFEEFSSVNEFAIEHFVSHTSAYKDFKQLKAALQSYDIEIDKEFHLRGNEKNIREFMTTVFLKVFQETPMQFSSAVTKEVHQFELDSWGPENLASQSEHNKMKQFYFLGVSLTRLIQGNSLQKQPFAVFHQTEADARLLAIHEWLVQRFPKNQPKLLYYEATLVYAFLVAEELLEVDETFILKQHLKIREYNHLFLSAVESVFPKALGDRATVKRELTRIHFQLVCFPTMTYHLYGRIDVTYFLETYPEFFSFCRDYLKHQKQQELLWHGREFLFYRYLLLLVTEISLKHFLSPIHVCLDFSFGKKYNQMIRQNMMKLYELNIIFQESVTEQTKLILSDRYFIQYSDIAQIVWLTPPRPVDWANLTKEILEIRRNK